MLNAINGKNESKWTVYSSFYEIPLTVFWQKIFYIPTGF